MNKRIVTKYGDSTRIAQAMNCTLAMVSKALTYKKDTPLARRIRHVAKTQYGAVEVEM
ncbi:MAG: hypothetical protein K6E73_10555 [Bacteroidales bacterium]|nr:hypothetical protein [Bacteroidales bacterium]